MKDRIQDRSAKQKVQKLYLKGEKKKRHGMKKVQFLIKVIFSHINVYQLQSSEAVNKNICANNLMFSNNTKCIKRNFRTKELAKTTKYMAPCLTIQTYCHY